MDYAPVLELAADRWEELEAAMGRSAVSRLNRRSDGTARFWEAIAPYAGRSSRLRTRFLECCAEDSTEFQASGLTALSRLRAGSSLLLDRCKRVLARDFNEQVHCPLDAAQATIVVSKLLAAQLDEDSSAVEAIVEASDSLRSQGAALVGLASRWPDHGIVVREYSGLLEGRPGPGLPVCVRPWLLSAQGTREHVVRAFAQFVTRRASSPWDFPKDALGAFGARLEREPEFEEALAELALERDEPSIRASAVRLLASMSATQGQDLAREQLDAEDQRSRPPRFARDILSNRIRLARDLMREALRASGGQVGRIQETCGARVMRPLARNRGR